MVSIFGIHKKIQPIVVVLFLYLVLVFLVNPFYEFSVNDDWLYKINVDSFLRGDFKITSLLDASSVLHILIGYFWALLFGSSFVSLRLLTILQTLLILVGVNSVIKLFTKSINKIYIVLLLTLANPILFTSSLSFMSEISFLLFTIWSVYFFLRSEEEKGRTYLFLSIGSILAGLSILIRQIGIILYIAYFISVIALYIRNIKSNKLDSHYIKKLLLSISIMSLFIFIWTLWPRYEFNAQSINQTGFADLLSKLIQPNQIPKRARNILFIPIYLGYFLSPVAFSFLSNVGLWKKVQSFFLQSKKRKMYTDIFTLFAMVTILMIFSYFVFKKDVFPIGTVFYVEGFYIKSNFRNNFSLFDNVLYKAFVSLLISFSTTYLVVLSYKHLINVRNKIKYSFNNLFMLFVMLGLLSSSFLGNDFYERYLLPFFIIFIIIVISSFDVINLNKGFFILLFLILSHMTIIQRDFNMHTNLRWLQGKRMMVDTGYVSGLYVDGVFSKYSYAISNDDYTGRYGYTSRGTTYRCFVSKYTLDTDSKVLNFLQGFDNFLQKYTKNPKIFDSKKIHGLSRPKNNLDNLMYNSEYSSLLYNLVGKKAYVGSWCLSDD